MSFHLLNPQTATSISKRIESSQFMLGIICVLDGSEISNWLFPSSHRHASGIEISGYVIMAVALLTILVAFIQKTRPTAFAILALLGVAASLTGMVIVSCVHQKLTWLDITALVFVAICLLFVLAQLWRHHTSTGSSNVGPA